MQVPCKAENGSLMYLMLSILKELAIYENSSSSSEEETQTPEENVTPWQLKWMKVQKLSFMAGFQSRKWNVSFKTSLSPNFYRGAPTMFYGRGRSFEIKRKLKSANVSWRCNWHHQTPFLSYCGAKGALFHFWNEGTHLQGQIGQVSSCRNPHRSKKGS